jgi:hypothetical protein
MDMTESSSHDIGVIAALVKRFESQRLPTLLEIKEKVDGGRTLDDTDIEFLARVLDDATRTLPHTESHPELHQFCSRVIHLYDHITTRALKNEGSK